MAVNCKDYDFSQIEPHWQSFWANDDTFHADDVSDKPKYYVLDMFPYPSGAGLHIGHPEGYTASDALKRFKKSQGYNTLHPMGWDAFGLPTEQYAIKTGQHPASTTAQNIQRFRAQLEQLGFTYNWDREINTTDPHYFKWTQWIFLQLFKHGLAYVDEKPVWWCPALSTVLANEEVIDGKSERGDHPVERRALRQWVLRITTYAEKLLEGLDDLDWPDSTRRLQKNWIGKSHGAEVDFALEDLPDDTLTVFTTRPDTLFGVTYMVLAPEHPLVDALVKADKAAAIEQYRQAAARKSDLERAETAKEKTGMFTGAYAINPINNERIPIWVADYVLMSYGTGAIMAVPAHDERDYAFAQTFDLPIKRVIGLKGKEPELPFVAEGHMLHSGEYDHLPSAEGKQKIIAALQAQHRGKATVNYKLRDWLFSRQRYWGEPFPIMWVTPEDYAALVATDTSVFKNLLPEQAVTCNMHGSPYCAVPVPPGHLPLPLPEVESYQPSGSGESPLAHAQDWLHIHLHIATGDTRPANGQSPEPGWIAAQRETNTMPQWAGSCWYYLRYVDPRNTDALIGTAKERYWGTPDLYIGGAEHAVLHLLYARFWHRFLFDIGVVQDPEPFKKLFHQGIILGEDGEKMSKSRGNVVNPETIIADYGADALRMYLMFLGPLAAMKPWNTQGIEGIARFLRKTWREYIDTEGSLNGKIKAQHQDDAETLKVLHETIKKVTDDYEGLQFNTAISQMMICLNRLAKVEQFSRTTAETFLQLLAPLAPHIAEELWQRMGNPASIANAPWPTHDASKIVSDQIKIIIQVNGKLRGELQVSKSISKEDILSLAKTQDRVASNLADKSIVKEIYVPGKIVNFVVK